MGVGQEVTQVLTPHQRVEPCHGGAEFCGGALRGNCREVCGESRLRTPQTRAQTPRAWVWRCSATGGGRPKKKNVNHVLSPSPLPSLGRYTPVRVGRSNRKQSIIAYDRILKSVERKLGKGVTADSQLTKVGKALLGDSYLGTFAVDVKPIRLVTPPGTEAYFIINVDGSNHPGSHWLAVYKSPDLNKYLIYDSFARKSKRLIPKFIKTVGFRYVDVNKKSDQEVKEDNCGQRSLAMLVFIKKYGYKKAKLI